MSSYSFSRVYGISHDQLVRINSQKDTYRCVELGIFSSNGSGSNMADLWGEEERVKIG